VTVQNTAPTAPVVEISPADPVEGEELVCAVVTGATDADGDAISYSFAWAVDGVAYVGAAASSYAGDTVLEGETFADEVWECAVSARDEGVPSASGVATVTVATVCDSGTVVAEVAGIEFVEVCARSFEMGCTSGLSPCDADESPAHTVTLTHSYMLSMTEVTQAQYSHFMADSPSGFSACGPDCPVENITWHQAAEFTNSVSVSMGLPNCYTCSGAGATVNCSVVGNVYDCSGFRLPTEAEWEGAARCGETFPYSGASDVTAVAWYAGNSGGAPRPVASLLANSCGLFDMSGNVYEWTQDWYSSAYYAGAVTVDPTGPESGVERVCRGGAWSDVAARGRVSNRNDAAPTYRIDRLGIRVARTVP
jgi:formylglycine-generating enzyme required for sulfatase activity